MSDCVLITEKEFNKGRHINSACKELDISDVSRDEKVLAETIIARNCRAVIVGVDRYTGPLYEALGQTGKDAGAIIVRYGVGHDGVDKTLARQNNIIVANTPGVLEVPVAEHAVWLMGALARGLAGLDSAIKAGSFVAQTGVELSGKTLAVVGFGVIGRRVAAMANKGLGMKVLAVDCRSAAELAEGEGKSPAQFKADYGLEACETDIASVLPRADFVTIHLSENCDTLNFFNAERFSLMKSDSFLVNTSRGSVVDENALYDALANSQLAGAGLDVFANEPYEPLRPDKDLRKLPNILMTAHSASNTYEANERMAKACLGNVTAFFAGRHDELTRVDI